MKNKIQSYKCNDCQATWSENVKAEYWVARDVSRLCQGCLNGANDQPAGKPVVWIIKVGSRNNHHFYNRYDPDGEVHTHPEGIKPFAKLADWLEIYDMCDVRIWAEPEPKTELEDYKKRLKSKVRELRDRAVRNKHANNERNAEGFLTLIDTI